MAFYLRTQGPSPYEYFMPFWRSGRRIKGELAALFFAYQARQGTNQKRINLQEIKQGAPSSSAWFVTLWPLNLVGWKVLSLEKFVSLHHGHVFHLPCFIILIYPSPCSCSVRDVESHGACMVKGATTLVAQHSKSTWSMGIQKQNY